MSNKKTGEDIKAIFDLEVSRLRDKSQVLPLDADDIRRFETLTRAYKTFQSTEEKDLAPDDPLDGLSPQELLELAKS